MVKARMDKQEPRENESAQGEDIAALDIPKPDILWALHKMCDDAQLHLLACDYAERVVHLCGDDPRPRAAIAAKRQWLRGEITDEDWDAARDAARDAEREWQIAHTVRVLST